MYQYIAAVVNLGLGILLVGYSRVNVNIEELRIGQNGAISQHVAIVQTYSRPGST